MDQTALAALGDRLREVGYGRHQLERRLRRIPARLTPSVLAVAERRAGGDELGLAIRLWCLGLPLSQAEASEALGGAALRPIVDSGLLSAGREVRASARITPALGRLHVHDFERGGALARDHVIGIGPAALTLSGITPRLDVGQALDLGTGCGVQAFGLAGHAERLVATDISARAAWATRMGARLNRLGALDVRIGDALEPVADESFDLIVCNPPFVISPSNQLTFRDTGMTGDSFAQRLVRELPRRLRAGGVVCILANWVVPERASAVDVARAWVRDLPADVLLLHHEELDPVAYAERWAGLLDASGTKSNQEELSRWLAELERLGGATVASGAFVIKRTDSASRVRVVPMGTRPSGGGSQVQRMLEAFGRFSGPEDPSLAATVFRLVPGHRVEQRLHYGAAGYAAEAATLRLDRSAGVLATVPADALEAVFLIDGRFDLTSIVGDIAEAHGSSQAELMERLAPLALELFERGFLTIADAERAA